MFARFVFFSCPWLEEDLVATLLLFASMEEDDVDDEDDEDLVRFPIEEADDMDEIYYGLLL